MVILKSKFTGLYVSSYVSNGGVYFRFNATTQQKAKRFKEEQINKWMWKGKIELDGLEIIQLDE